MFVPPGPATVRLTVLVPALGYVMTKFVALVLVVLPSPNVQKWFVIEPSEPSLKVTVSGGFPEVGLAVNKAKGAGGETAVISEDELLAGFGSAARDETVTVLVAYPAVAVVTRMLILARAPLVMVPRLNVTMPFALLKVPMLFVAETKFTIEGSVSTSSTSEAVFGPRLVRLIVYVILLPMPVEVVEAPVVRFRSARLFPPQQIGGVRVVIVRLQPPAMLPESPAESSYTYKLQVPVGSIPLNIDKLVP